MVGHQGLVNVWETLFFKIIIIIITLLWGNSLLAAATQKGPVWPGRQTLDLMAVRRQCCPPFSSTHSCSFLRTCTFEGAKP